MENNTKKSLILLVDDSEDFREIMSARLNADGFETICVSNGEEAVSRLRECNPDLIVLDLEMPGLNGVETLMQIKSEPELKNMKVVFLTNYGEPQEKLAEVDKKFATQVGALCYLRKTDDMSHIIKEIREHAGSSSADTD